MTTHASWLRRNRRKLRNNALIAGAVAAVATANAPMLAVAGGAALTSYEQSRPAYKAQFGSWETIEMPQRHRVNAVHSVLLSSGKVLIVAGSGNNQRAFDAGSFTTVLWDPQTNTSTSVPTPKDLFCGGHAFLPDGNVLIAGGTRKYEVLAGKVKRAAGVMTVRNHEVGAEPFTIHKWAVFISDADGRRYRATEEVQVQPAQVHGSQTHPSETQLWVQAVGDGPAYAFTNQGRQFTLDGLDVPGLYGLASNINLDKQEYRGLDASYIFNVRTEKYEQTGKLRHARWYPSLLSTKGGDVLAVSGLDQYGIIDPGHTERFSPSTRTWRSEPSLHRYFPTYPALFRLADERVFFSGSNAGYGPDDKGRTPGIWDLGVNSFHAVAGLRDPQKTETSSSVLLPPAQQQKVMIVGGGSVGDRKGSTARTDVADLDSAQPRYTPGPDLPESARYVSTVILPDDHVLMTGGSSDYRGRSGSDVLRASLYDPRHNTLAPAAPPKIGRNYHSEAMLLPDGRVVTLGSDPLYGNNDNSEPGTFEQRVEIYSPPYLFDKGPRPTITSAPSVVDRGSHFSIGTGVPVRTARLVRPSATTHVTDLEQRSVALSVKQTATGARLGLQQGEGLTPRGWYMLFVTDADGTPSVGRWVRVR